MNANPILLAKNQTEIFLLPQMANRHGLIAGATGTGKTITLQVLAENFSAMGVPVFLADVKGDLAGICLPGGQSSKVQERVKQLGLTGYAPSGCPITFWDVFGEQGHPVRGTISELGPLLLARLLELNEIQAGVLNIVFRVADDNGLLLLDLKDLRAMLQYVGENSPSFTAKYGNISAASIGAIQRGLLQLETQGGDKYFGEPAINLDDFIQTDGNGRGIINLLAADKLMQSPRIYATLLLWLLSELFERLPEVGDPEKPKLVFFFDEAHLLFNEIPPPLLQKIEQVVRLVRSKGVGVYFISQNPRDIPDNILGQLGNRVQHALRAFTPLDQKAVQTAADTFRANPKFKTADAIMQLGVGEALVSCLDEKGQPQIVERAWIVPPRSQIGPIPPETRKQLMLTSIVAGVYEKAVDRESAYEKLAQAHSQPAQAAPGGGGFFSHIFGGGDAPAAPPPTLNPPMQRTAGPRGDTVATVATKAIVRSFSSAIGSSVGRQVIRGVLGSIFGGRR